MNALKINASVTAAMVVTVIVSTPLRADDRSSLYAAVDRAEKYEKASRLAEAAAEFERALALAPRVFGPTGDQTTVIQNNLANVYREMGHFAKAETLYQRSLAIKEANFGKDHAKTALSLNNLAVLYVAMGEYGKAEPLYQRSLAIYEATYGKFNADTATALNNLASFYKRVSQFAKAESLYLRSLAIYDAKLGKDHPDTANALNNLATLYRAMGQYAKAEPIYQRALSIREARLGRDHLDTAAALNNLATLYGDMSQFAKAEPLYLQALAIKEAKLGREHSSTAIAVNNLATLYKDMGQFAKAEPLYRRSLAIREAKLGSDHPGTALALNNLATLYNFMDRHGEAEPLFLRALAINEAKVGKDQLSTALTLNNLAVLYKDMGDAAKAEPLYLRSLAIYEAKLGTDHPDTANSLNNLANLYASTSDWTRSAQYRDRLRRQVRGFVSTTLPILSESEQDQFLKQKDEDRFHACLSHGLARREHAAERDLSVGWLLNGKAVAGQVRAEGVLLSRESNDPRSATLSRQLVEVRQTLAVLSLNPPVNSDAGVRAEQLRTLAAKEQELARQLTQITGRAAKAEWVEPVDVRKRLQPTEVLIEIARFNRVKLDSKPGEKASLGERYAAWIIPAVGEVAIVDLGEAEAIDQAVAAARVELQAAATTIKEKGEPKAEEALRTSLNALAEKVLRPLLPQIGSFKNWIISPDGQLWLVPWAALPLADGKYAIEAHTIHHVVSGRDLLTRKNDKVTLTAPLVMADPDFDSLPPGVRLAGQKCPGTIGDWKVAFAFLADGTVRIHDTDGSIAGEGKWAQDGERITMTTARATFTGTLAGNRASGERSVAGTAARDRWVLQIPDLGASNGGSLLGRGQTRESRMGKVRRLPGTAIEAEAIAPKLKEYVGVQPRILSEQEAEVAAFKRVKNPRVLVLSTHGFFLDEAKTGGKRSAAENPLLRCGLLFAGCNHADRAAPGADNGVLTGIEIVGTDLRGTELVVLSACETGLGDIRNGEGVAGLRQAFQLAGAESVIATLWQVPDRDSALLMAAIFGKLATQHSPNVALGEAQREMIRARRDRFGASHPYYWAAYTLTGQTK